MLFRSRFSESKSGALTVMIGGSTDFIGLNGAIEPGVCTISGLLRPLFSFVTLKSGRFSGINVSPFLLRPLAVASLLMVIG